MPKQKKSSYQPVANPEYIAAMRDIRKSGATTPHKTGTPRENTRETAQRRAIKDSE